jgi:hypothetical protein
VSVDFEVLRVMVWDALVWIVQVSDAFQIVSGISTWHAQKLDIHRPCSLGNREVWVIIKDKKIQGDCKLCKRLRNLIGKKVTATQELNKHHCNGQLISSFIPVQVQCVLHVLTCTHQDVIRHSAKHSAIMAYQLLQSLFVRDPSSRAGLQALAERKSYFSQSPTGKIRGGGGAEKWRSWRPGSALRATPNPRTIHRSGNCQLKDVVTSLWMCGGAPPCCKTSFDLSWSSWGIKHNTNVSR